MPDVTRVWHRRMGLGRLAMAVSVLAVVAGPVGAQQPAPPVDPTPLARPMPVAVMKSGDPFNLLARVQDVLVKSGYAVTTADRTSADAKKSDAGTSKGYDRVLVWVERDFDQPLEYVKLYLVYGRYEEIWGTRREIARVRVDASQEADRTAALRDAIVRLGR